MELLVGSGGWRIDVRRQFCEQSEEFLQPLPPCPRCHSARSSNVECREGQPASDRTHLGCLCLRLDPLTRRDPPFEL